MGSAIRFKNTRVPRQKGEQARLKVVSGPDAGAVFVLVGTSATIGRGEENDAVILDLKASRKHAEFALGAGGWEVRDAGSANGILHNGKKTAGGFLKTGDTVSMGETTLEFMASDNATMMLVAPPKSLAEIGAERSAFEAQRKSVLDLARIGGVAVAGAPGKAASGFDAKNILKNRKVQLALVGLVAAFLLLGDDGPQKKPGAGPKDDKKDARDLASFLPDAVSSAVAKPAEMFFRAGFREYRERNYLRAKVNFETVLQMDPGHRLAMLYLENCDKGIKDEVKLHQDRAKKDLMSGKLKTSKAHYESIMRLLYRDQTNPSFIEARDQLDKISKIMAGGDA
ncbi:MAG: hypothetical protein A2583_00500 [Bdellovibrionales bacterium RIFOXYD1_FULL_53_11]|nr:MAG: hypothetical protein A2583_00500 [Bdellovibrionales bacterium RIFOXYD1_FULL_53_11]